MSARLVGLSLALLAAPALARDLEGHGRISVLGGWRLTPNDAFFRRAEAEGWPAARRSPGGPQLTGQFAYAATPLLEIGVDLFAGGERLELKDRAPITSYTYGALVDLRFLFEAGPFTPYLGLHYGPLLVFATDGREGQEVLTGSPGLSAGALFWLGPHFALTVDARLLLARGGFPGLGSLNGGGAWFGLGVCYLFPKEASGTGLR